MAFVAARLTVPRLKLKLVNRTEAKLSQYNLKAGENVGEDEIPQNFRRVKHQFIAAFVVNLLTVSFGVFEGWVSPSIFLYKSDGSPLKSGRITYGEASWIASIINIGALMGNIFFGLITNRFGRKWSLLAISIPMIICWSLILFGNSVEYFYAARFFGGFFGGGGYTLVPLFLNEIADDHIRGKMISTQNLSETSGVLLAFFIGNFNLDGISIFAMVLTVIFAIAFIFLPESPIFLLKEANIKKIEKSIRYYKNIGNKAEDQIMLAYEIQKLKTVLDDIRMEHSKQEHFDWRDLTKEKNLKALVFGVILVAMCIFGGMFTMLNYTAIIIEATGSNLSPNVSAIIVGLIQLLGAIVSTDFIDRFGRKVLLIISSLGTAFGLIVLGVYMTLRSSGVNVESFNWVPVTSFSWSVFVSSFGLLFVTVIVMVEIMPDQIKNLGVSFCMLTFGFLNMKFFPLFIDGVGLNVCFFIFAGVDLLCALFTFVFIPETRKKSHDEIMELLEEKVQIKFNFFKS